jgi:hypothetical protein
LRKLTRKQFERLARRAAEGAVELVIQKNKDYSPAEDCLRNFRHGGTRSVGYRMAEKTTRLVNLLDKRKNVNFESVEDTVMDLFGYMILFMVLLKSER